MISKVAEPFLVLTGAVLLGVSAQHVEQKATPIQIDRMHRECEDAKKVCEQVRSNVRLLALCQSSQNLCSLDLTDRATVNATLRNTTDLLSYTSPAARHYIR